MTSTGSETPWTSAQVRLAVACDLAAALALAVATVEAGDATLEGEVLWLNVAVLGLVLVVVVNGSLLLVARRTIGQRRHRLLPDVVVPVAAPDRTPGGSWWWLPGTTRAHRSGCQMIAGKPAEEIPAERIRSEQLVRCEVCG